MSAYASQPTRSRALTIEATRTSVGTFDADAWHVMEARDDVLIQQEILHGTGSSKFVYQFQVSGQTVAGISVVGARHLAAHYGGIKHRLIASVAKIGALFTFTSYPQPGMPMHVSAQVIPELEQEDDFYEVIVELEDVKKGNVIQVRKREGATEKRRDGSRFERPHYSLIAESKAFRNGVLALVDQAVQLKWREQMLMLGKEDVITDSIVDEKRANVLRFAASKSISIERRNLEALTMDQLAGLGDAARAGGVDEFRRAAEALHVVAMPNVVQQAGAGQPAPRLAQQDPPRGNGNAAPTQETRQEPKPEPQQTRPTFSGFLADEFGEAAADLPFTVPGQFLMAVANLAAKSSNVPALLENNADAIEDARAADPHVGATFDAEIAALHAKAAQKAPTETASEKAAAPADPLFLAMPLKGQRQDLQGYHTAAVEALGKLPTEADVSQWSRANDATLQGLPSVTKRAVQQAIAARADALKAGAEPPRSSGPTQAEMRDILVKELQGTRTLSELETTENIRTFVLRRDRLDEAMRDEVHAAARAHWDALNAAQG